MSNAKVWQNLTANPYVGLGLTAVVVAIAGYFLLKKAASDTAAGVKSFATGLADVTGLTTASTVFGSTGNALADNQSDTGTDTLASWYDPTLRTVFFYYLTFPDGNHHFVGASAVATDGTFVKDTLSYRIGTSRAGDLRAYNWNP